MDGERATMPADEFGAFFHAATGHKPFDYQRRLAGDPSGPDAILDGPKSLAIGQGEERDGRSDLRDWDALQATKREEL
jgi:hypothetical protein